LDISAPNPAAGGRAGALRFGGNYAPSAISCNCSQIINTYPKAIGPRVGFAYSWDDKTVFRGGYGIMYTRRGAVGGRENARLGSGFTGINVSAPLNPVNTFDPAFYWQNGIPAFVTGPIYDQTYQTGFNGNGAGGAVTYADPNSQPPRYQNWNLSVQRSLTSSMVLTLAYVGSNGKQLAGAGHGIFTNQLDPKYLVLGGLLTQNATPTTVAQAAAILPGIALPFPNFVGTIAQMLRPFPQYNSVADPYGNVGQVNYHALQASLQQRLSNGLTFNVNYTYSKAIGNIFGIRSAYHSDWDKSISNTDMPHVFNVFYAYNLPFGKGRMLDPGNKILRSLVDGWTVSGITRYASGVPLGPFIGNCTLPQAGTCYADYNPNFTGPIRINGDWGNGNVLGSATALVNPSPAYIDKSAFLNAQPFTYGNTPVLAAYGLRSQPLFNTDVSVSRTFRIKENLRFIFGADGYNVFNAVRFAMASGYNNINNANFGRVGSQNNLPRVFQFKFRIEM
jgi:hypothetical protein